MCALLQAAVSELLITACPHSFTQVVEEGKCLREIVTAWEMRRVEGYGEGGEREREGGRGGRGGGERERLRMVLITRLFKLTS